MVMKKLKCEFEACKESNSLRIFEWCLSSYKSAENDEKRGY